MKIKAFSFERDSFTLSDVKKSVVEAIDGVGIYFESFSNTNNFFEAVSAAMNDNDVVILGVESSLYLKFKPILIKAFNFTPSYSGKIQERIPASINDEKTRKAHMLIPDEATELLTDDGLYSGFYVISEGKHIVVLPLKNETSVNLLRNSSFSFIKRKSISVVSVDDEPTDDILEKAKAVVAKLNEYDLRIAIPTTPAAQTLQEKLELLEGGERVLFTPFVNDKGITEPKEYSAELARGAKELKNVEIGATISTIFREKKGDITLSYYAFIGVAIEEKVVVRKLIASADESVPNLVKEASIELYNLIDKYIDEFIFKTEAPVEEVAKYEVAQIESEIAAELRPTASLSKNGMIAAIAIFVLALVACVVVGIKFSGYLDSTTDEPETDVLQQVQTTQGVATTEPTTAPSESASVPLETFQNIIPTTESSTGIFDVVTDNTIPNSTRPQYQPQPTQAPTQPKPTQPKPTKPSEPAMSETDNANDGFRVEEMP